MTAIERVIAWDTETALIRPGKLAPELACLSYQVYDLATKTRSEPKLVSREEAGALMWMWLTDPTILLVGQNVSYDVAVMMAAFPELTGAFFRAYDQDRFADTMLRQQLILIAAGKFKGWLNADGEWTRPRFDLEGQVKLYTGKQLDKDTWRMRYGEFILPDTRAEDLNTQYPDHIGKEIPLELWPEGAREYPKQDAVGTLDVFLAQEDVKEYIPDQFDQARFAFWKHLCACRGLRTDAKSVMRFKAATEKELDAVKERLVEAGLVRANGTRDTKAAKERMVAVCEAKGMPLRKTKSDGIALDADACEATEDDILEDYALYTTALAIMSKDIPMLLAGAQRSIHTRFGMAESGRTTSSSNKDLGPGTGNLQNLRRGAKQRKGETKDEFKKRKAATGDIRQCFVPRAGYVFIQADYEGLELRTLAQVCFSLFGRSALRDALNAGRDPHTEVAARLLKCTYEEALLRIEAKEEDAVNARQTGKVANFGFPGGLGAKKLVLFARKTYGVIITEAEAKDLKRVWLEQYPEMNLFFEYVGNLEGRPVTQLFSNRIRGGCTFCQACNTYFQGLGADASQYAGWLITKACYLDQDSPLYGCRIVNYIHDEFFLECPLTKDIDAAARELERLMVLGAKKYIPDVNVAAPPCAMTCWSKEAKAKFNAEGKLIPWSPEMAA